MEKAKVFVQKRARLRQLLLKYSYKEGIFTLTSGKKTDFYIDVKETALMAEGAFLIGQCFYDLISKQELLPVQAVAGITLGADPLITATSMAGYLNGHELPGIIIRKEAKDHGTGNQLEIAGNVPKGAVIALLDDVVTAAGTLLQIGVKALEKEGFTVAQILSVVDRQENGAAEWIQAAGYKYQPIFTREELLAE